MNLKRLFFLVPMFIFVALGCNFVSSVFPDAMTPTVQLSKPASSATADLIQSPLAGLTYSVSNEDTNRYQLWQIAKNGKPQLVMNHSGLIFSPDGHQAAYVDDNKCTWLLDYQKNESKPLDCSYYTRLTESDVYLNMTVIGWIPNQPNKLIMLFDASAGFDSMSGWLGTLSLSDGTTQILDYQHRVNSSQMALSPDGKTIAYSSGNGVYQSAWLYSFDSGLTHLKPQDFNVKVDGLTTPAWSPDGETIAWLGSSESRNDSLVVFDLKNKMGRLLHPYSHYYPQVPEYSQDTTALGQMVERLYLPWSPDGQWLAFDVRAADKNGDFDEKHSGSWILSIDGKTEHQLAGKFDSWSSDGQWLLYWKKQKNEAVPENPQAILMAAHAPDGAGAIPIAKSTFQGGEPFGAVYWSPIGDHLLFEDDNREFWIAETGIWKFTHVSLPSRTGSVEWISAILPPYDQLKVFPAPTSQIINKFKCSGAPLTRFHQAGDKGRIPLTNQLSTPLQPGPEVGDHPLANLTAGTEFTVLDGPVCAAIPERNDQSVYWKISVSAENLTGWVAEADFDNFYIEPLP